MIPFFIYNFRGITVGNVNKCIHRLHFHCSTSCQKNTCLVARPGQRPYSTLPSEM